ncbi:MAG: hypothetical protein NTY15_03730 [Planctomycetota bacterium]|nr:hypothetical protein [Planctomycetota bacterium]
MRSSKSAAYQARRKTFCRLAQRRFGLECLEKRTVFASDLSDFLNEAGVCFESAAEESRSTPTPSVNRTVEVANSQLSLLQGDALRFEVPASLLLQLTDRDSYQLQVFYSENYFAYDSNMLQSRPSEVIYGDIGAGSLLANAAESHRQVLADRQNDQNVTDKPASDFDYATGEYSAILLGSLTASSDFDGYVRVFDLVQEPGLGSTNASITELPNEVRIVPRVTVPTAMRDPGATLVKTIVVNRATNGIFVATENSRIESVANDGIGDADATDSRTTDAPPATSDEQKQSRSVVTLKTIDISLARRNEVSRPWLRSSSIPNPVRQRESDLIETASRAMTIVSTPPTKSDAESNKPTRRELRVPGTKLQPVEFILAESIIDLDGVRPRDRDRIRATDQAISDYTENEWTESSQAWGQSGLMQMSLIELNDPVSKPLFLADNRISAWDRSNKTMLAQLEDWYFLSIHSGFASNKESWKNAVRSASESVVGQAMLASLTSLAVPHRDMNAFGTKTAWDFVTKSAGTRPV